MPSSAIPPDDDDPDIAALQLKFEAHVQAEPKSDHRRRFTPTRSWRYRCYVKDYAIVAAKAKRNFSRARTERITARRRFELEPGATDNRYGIGWLIRKPSATLNARRVVLTKEIVGKVLRLHRDMGHPDLKTMQKLVITEFFGVPPGDVEWVVEHCPQCTSLQTGVLPDMSQHRAPPAPIIIPGQPRETAATAAGTSGGAAGRSALTADEPTTKALQAASCSLSPLPPLANVPSTPPAKSFMTPANIGETLCATQQSQAFLAFLHKQASEAAAITAVAPGEAHNGIAALPVAPLEEIELAVHEVRASCHNSMMKWLVCIVDVATLYTVLRAIERRHEKDLADVVMEWATHFCQVPAKVRWPKAGGSSVTLRCDLAKRLQGLGVHDVVDETGVRRGGGNAVASSPTTDILVAAGNATGSAHVAAAARADEDVIALIEREIAAWMDKHPNQDWIEALTPVGLELNERSLAALCGLTPRQALFAGAVKPAAAHASPAATVAASAAPAKNSAMPFHGGQLSASVDEAGGSLITKPMSLVTSRAEQQMALFVGRCHLLFPTSHFRSG
jgi:hypothetical protein